MSRFWQKQKIKRDYARAARAAGQTAQGAAGAATKTAQASAAAAKKAAKESKKGASFLVRHWKGALLIGGVGLMLLLIMAACNPAPPCLAAPGRGLRPRPICPRTTICWGPKPPTQIWRPTCSMSLTTTKPCTPAMTNTTLIWTTSAMTPMC